MTLYQNRLITLSFNQDTGILTVTWSNTSPYDSEEVQQSVNKVIEAIKEYKCQKLLIDASVANFSMDDAELIEVLTNFAYDLSQTSIRKLARIITSDAAREEKNRTIRNGFTFPFEIYDISNREQALHWLEKN